MRTGADVEPQILTTGLDEARKRGDSIVDKLVSDVLKQIEDEIRANHPGLSDSAITLLHATPCLLCGTGGRLRGVGGTDPGYIFAPYMPIHVVDCRPWWPGIWHWSWWVTLARESRIGRWWAARKLRRYARKIGS